MDEVDLQERNTFLRQTEACFDRNELPAVLNLAEARLKRTPGDLDARIVICRAWLLQGRLDEARDMLREMEDILASLSQIYACIGDICMKKGMKDSADEFYQKFKLLSAGAPPSRDIAERLNEMAELQEADAEGDTEVPADFQTLTLAELYIRQGHLQLAEEVLEKILGQDPQNEKAEGLRREVSERLLQGVAGQQYQHAGVIAELSRWLDNIDRLRAHAA